MRPAAWLVWCEWSARIWGRWVLLHIRNKISDRWVLPHLLDLSRPSFDAIAFTADCDVGLDAAHAFRLVQEGMIGHATSIGSIGWLQFEHGQQELSYPLGLLHREVVFFSQDVR